MFPKCLYCALQRMLLPTGTYTNKSTRKIFGLNGLRLYVVQEEHTSRCPGRSYLTLSGKIIPHVVREDHTSRCPGKSYLTLPVKIIPHVVREDHTSRCPARTYLTSIMKRTRNFSYLCFQLVFENLIYTIGK